MTYNGKIFFQDGGVFKMTAVDDFRTINIYYHKRNFRVLTGNLISNE